ncbi:MAG: hypothetical protein H0T39_15490 [Actinobacteria bacterium]|nr:hypothetical protein [Actinomycetota bacterium]
MLARLTSSIPYEDVAAGARFLWSLPGFLRRPISVDEARATLRRRFERREPDFLALAKRAAYGHATSPYRQLLELAGCEYGDLERLVCQEGIEGALDTLYREGVYLTVDELKGRRPTVRGSATIAVDLARLRNSRSASHLPTQSSGSRGMPTDLVIDLAVIRDRAVNLCLAFDARGGATWRHALWAVPGGATIARLLEYSSFDGPPVRWFSQVDPAGLGLHARYRWSGRAMRWGSLLAGVPLPVPRYIPLDDPLPIADWMAGILRGGGTPHLHTFASPAVRLCRAARDARLDLRGARFTLTGEPVTESRQAVVSAVGGESAVRYGTNECSAIGYGCLEPEAPDDIHLFHDLYALIQPGQDARSGLPPRALLVSALRPTSPLFLLNVSLGDQGELVRRACGCPLERLGWTMHLHTIRSFEKLTAGGMTFPDPDIIRVLEVVLPARFGGGPTDYQLLEEEAEDGQARLRLLVHPAVGPLDAEAAADAFLAAIGGGSGIERVMALQWRESQVLRVERRAPLTTASGKILHLHQQRRSSNGRPDPAH